MPSKEDRIREFAKFSGRFSALDVAKALDLGSARSVSQIIAAIPEIRAVDTRKTGEHQSYTYEWVGP